MPRIYIGIGSNIEPCRHVEAALDRLADRFGELLLSPVYQSDAIGFEGAPFLNMVAGLHTDLAVAELAALLRTVESDNGYRGGAPKFSSRTLDLDLLTYGDAVGLVDGIELPRADITAYAYVLWPLADIAGAEAHPRLGITYGQLRERFDAKQALAPLPFTWRGRDLSAAALSR